MGVVSGCFSGSFSLKGLRKGLAGVFFLGLILFSSLWIPCHSSIVLSQNLLRQSEKVLPDDLLDLLIRISSTQKAPGRL